MLGEPLKERAPFERISLRHRWDVCVRYVPAWADLSLMGRATNAATARTPILRCCSKFSTAKRTAERKERDSQNISSLLFIILLFRLFISFWGVMILFCLSFAVLLCDGVIKSFLSFFLSFFLSLCWYFRLWEMKSTACRHNQPVWHQNISDTTTPTYRRVTFIGLLTRAAATFF